MGSLRHTNTHQRGSQVLYHLMTSQRVNVWSCSQGHGQMVKYLYFFFFDSFIYYGLDPNKWIQIQRCWWTLPCLCHCDASPVQSPSLFFDSLSLFYRNNTTCNYNSSDPRLMIFAIISHIHFILSDFSYLYISSINLIIKINK